MWLTPYFDICNLWHWILLYAAELDVRSVYYRNAQEPTVQVFYISGTKSKWNVRISPYLGLWSQPHLEILNSGTYTFLTYFRLHLLVLVIFLKTYIVGSPSISTSNCELNSFFLLVSKSCKKNWSGQKLRTS